MKKIIVSCVLFICIAFACNGIAAEKTAIETGENYITNGLIKIEVLAPSTPYMIRFSVWNEEGKTWAPVFGGSVGIGGTGYFEVLDNESPDEIKTVKSGDSAAVTFKLTDYTKDEQGKGGDGKFYQTYKITIRNGSHQAKVEMVDEAPGGKKQAAWHYNLLVSVPYLIGKNVLNGPDNIIDCRTTFDNKGQLFQIKAGDSCVGGFDPATGILTLIYQPDLYYMLAFFKKEGVRSLYPVTGSYSLCGQYIGRNKEPQSALDIAEKIRTELSDIK